MPKDAKFSPRSIDTFGVSGLLGDQSEVFYENLFSTRHIGRVSDLIAAKLREAGLSEIRLRTVLLFTAFEGARAKMLETEQPYEDPIQVECGIDEEKIAIGVSFATGGTWTPALEGLETRVTAGTPSDEIEHQLAALCRTADAVFLKISSDEKRVELAAVMLLRRPASAAERVPTLTISRVDMEARKESPKPQVYTELGDLDHAALLNADTRGGLRSIAGGEGAGGVASGGDIARISGGTSLNDADAEELARFRADSAHAADQEMTRVKGGSAVEDASATTVGPYIERIHVLETRIAELEEQGPVSAAVRGYSGFSLKKLWPFKKSGAAHGPEEALLRGADTSEAEAVVKILGSADEAEPATLVKGTPSPAEETTTVESLAAAEKESLAAAAAAAQADPEEADNEIDLPKLRDPQEIVSDAQMSILESEVHAKRLAEEINEGEFDRVVQRAKKELVDIKKLVPNETAQRWINGLMENLISEKSRLYEMSLALNANLRKKELDFKVQEQKLLAELRARDSLVKKNSTALVHARDKLAKVALQMEKLKVGAATSKDDAQFKQRYGMAQKLLAASKKDNAELLAKIMDLKGQLTKNRGPSPAEFMALKSKNERSMKQIEELRRSNQTYMERLNANKPLSPAAAAAAAASAAESTKARGPSGPQTEELRKKLELATRSANKSQVTVDLLTLKVEEQDKEVARLKRELIRVQNDFRKKAAISGTSGGNTGNPPAAA